MQSFKQSSTYEVWLSPNQMTAVSSRSPSGQGRGCRGTNCELADGLRPESAAAVQQHLQLWQLCALVLLILLVVHLLLAQIVGHFLQLHTVHRVSTRRSLHAELRVPARWTFASLSLPSPHRCICLIRTLQLHAYCTGLSWSRVSDFPDNPTSLQWTSHPERAVLVSWAGHQQATDRVTTYRHGL